MPASTLLKEPERMRLSHARIQKDLPSSVFTSARVVSDVQAIVPRHVADMCLNCFNL